MKTIPLFENYSLRPICMEDVHDVFTSIDTQRRYLGQWLPFVAATTREEQTREVVLNMIADSRNPIFTIRANNAFAGLIGFKSFDSATATIEIGYWLREEHQGKGIMHSAVEQLCNIASEELGVHTVEIKCAVGNLPSNRIPQHLGFRLNRIEPDGELLSDGHYVDINVYSLTK